MIIIKTYYIKQEKTSLLKINKIKIDDGKCIIYSKLKSEREMRIIARKMSQKGIENVILPKELYDNEIFIKWLKSNQINIIDGKWLGKYLVLEMLEFIVEKRKIKKEETNIAVTINEITDLTIETIKALCKQYKRVTIVTRHMEKLRRIEKEIYSNEGISIIISNNQKKSLTKSQIIINFDFNNEIINKYKINENAVILNLEGNIQIQNKRFNGININDYEIKFEDENNQEKEYLYEYRAKDIYEAEIKIKDNFYNIRAKIKKDNVKIKEMYGNRGKIERFY